MYKQILINVLEREKSKNMAESEKSIKEAKIRTGPLCHRRRRRRGRRRRRRRKEEEEEEKEEEEEEKREEEEEEERMEAI